MKRSYKVEVRVKRCDVVFHPDLSPGVLAEQTVTYDLPEDFSKERLVQSIALYGRELLEDAVELVYTEVTE